MKHLLLALLLAASAPAQAALFDQPASVEQLKATLGPMVPQLASARVLRGRYVQRKQLAELPRPLVAEGTFLFVRGHGIVWRTTLPFASELVVTRDALVQRDGGNEVRVSAGQQPAVRLIAGIFFSVFALDFDALRELFALYGQAEGAGWRLGLKPLQGGGALREIEVTGGRDVQRVILREGNGDRTEIELLDSRTSREPPTAAELAPFGP